MIVQLFKNLADFKWIAAFLIMIAMFLPFDFNVSSAFESFSLLQKFQFFDFLNVNQSILLSILSASLIVLFLSLFHYMLMIHKLISSRNFLGVLYSLLFIVLWLPDITDVYGIISVGLFYLSIYYIFTAEDSSMPLLRIFDASFLISLSCMLNVFFIPFLILPFVALLLFRLFDWRLIASAITGIILPHFFLMSMYFLFHDKTFYPELFTQIFSGFKIGLNNFIAYPVHWISFAPVLLLTALKTFSSLGERKIIVRKKSVFLIWITVFSILLLFFENGSPQILILMIAFPLGYFIATSLLFLHEKRIFIFLTDIAIPAIIVYHVFFS